MDKHTTGPWKAEISNNQFAHSDEAGKTGYVALICGNYEETGRYGDSLARVTTSFYPSPDARKLSRDEWTANARLMAASPEMLEALELAETTLEQFNAAQRVREVVQSAIRKARGEK